MSTPQSKLRQENPRVWTECFFAESDFADSSRKNVDDPGLRASIASASVTNRQRAFAKFGSALNYLSDRAIDVAVCKNSRLGCSTRLGSIASPDTVTMSQIEDKPRFVSEWNRLSASSNI